MQTVGPVYIYVGVLIVYYVQGSESLRRVVELKEAQRRGRDKTRVQTTVNCVKAKVGILRAARTAATTAGELEIAVKKLTQEHRASVKAVKKEETKKRRAAKRLALQASKGSKSTSTEHH